MNQQPFPSWIYNEELTDWEAPIPLPSLTKEDKQNKMVYRWNENLNNWELVKFPFDNLYPHIS
jgi:hypothetical protein